MNGQFKSVVINKDTIINKFDKIVLNSCEDMGLAMEGKSLTEKDVRIKVFFPNAKNPKKPGSLKNMSGYQKRGTW